MQIAPFSFREFGEAGEPQAATARPERSFMKHGQKKEEVAPPPPPPPVFTEADLKNAERDGYQKGYIAGMEEGKSLAHSEQTDADEKLSQTLETFVIHLAPLFATYRNFMRDSSKQMPGMAYAIAKKVAGSALEANAANSIEEIAARCIETMMHEPKLVVTVHESLKDNMEARLQTLAEKLRVASEIIVVGDSYIAIPNCRIEWKHGGMHRNTEEIWQQVEQVIQSMVASAARDADTVADTIEPTLLTPPSEGA